MARRTDEPVTAESNVGWLTMHEVLEATEVPYRELEQLVAAGRIRTRRSGAALLFDPDDVARLGRRG